MSLTTNDSINAFPRARLSKGRMGGRVTFFHSRKNGGTIACSNLLQADHCVLLEYRQDVQAYECRPPTLRRGKTRYSADFRVLMHNGMEVYHKLLLAHDLDTPWAKAELAAAEALLLKGGYLFRWLTPERLPAATVTHNLRYLYHLSHAGSHACAHRVQKMVRDKRVPVATVQELLADGAAPSDICLALFLGYLHTDLHRPFTPQSRIEDNCHEAPHSENAFAHAVSSVLHFDEQTPSSRPVVVCRQ